MPSTTRWREITRLFDAVANLGTAERARYLDDACKEDEDLRRRLESLLAADSQVEKILRDLDVLAVDNDTPTSPGLTETLVGPYRLLEKLGHGGMGIVFKARDLRLGRLVALKFLLGCPEGEARRRLLKEARAAALLDHPNVCTVYEVGETARGQVFLAMAYSEGETLKQRLVRGPLAVGEAADLATQMAQGLLAAHRQGVVHCDLKPSNVLITTDGVARLCDFGIARVAGSDETASVGLRGTPAYMAPERLRGEPADARSDLWSLGVVLYEMLAGEPPFRSEHAPGLFEGILRDSPRPVTEVRADAPVALGRIVTRLLAKGPEGRYPSAEVLLEELRAFGMPGPPGDRAASSPARVRRTAVAAALLLLLLTVLGWVGSRLVRGGAQAPAADLQAVAVLPFEVEGNPRLAYLREGLVELLATRLDGAGDVRGIDPNVLLASTLEPAGGERSVDRGRTVAARFGAGSFVLGTVLDLGGKIRLSASLYDAAGELKVHEEAVAEGESALLPAVDDLARGLLAGILGAEPDQRLGSLAARTTSSLPALKAYLAGEEALRNGQFEKAVEDYQRAVGLDSTFALAWYRLARAAVWTNGRLRKEALEQALRHEGRLPERDRLLLRAADAMDGRRTLESEQLYREILARYPDDAEAWQMLGEVLYHNNRRYGRPPNEARAPFEHALSYLPGHHETLVHLMDIALKEHRLDAFDRLSAQFLEAPAGGAREDWASVSAYRALRRLVHEGPDARERLVGELAELGPQAVRDTLRRTSGLLEDLAAARLMALALIEAGGSSWERAGRESLWRIELARGRRLEAELALAEPVPSGNRLVLRALDGTHPFSPYPASRLRGLEQELLAWDPLENPPRGPDGQPMHPGLEGPIRAYLLGLVAARRGDGEAVERYRSALASSKSDLMSALAGALAANEAWGRGRYEEVRAALDGVRTAYNRMFEAGSTSDFTLHLLNADFLRAELLVREQRYEEALRLYQAVTDGTDAGLFLLAPSYLRRAQITELMGDREEAAVYYGRFVDLWAACDGDLRPEVEKARLRLKALGSPRDP